MRRAPLTATIVVAALLLLTVPLAGAIPPNVTGFSPTSGPVGTTVTINGTDFDGATDVSFNGTAAGFTVDSSTQITATVPAGATDGTISVTTPEGPSTSLGSFDVIPAPSVTGFSPTSGPVGTTVTINGSDFGGATGVSFNGTAAGFTVDSSTQITATVPAGATDGTISVTTPGGTDTSPGSFNVTIPPVVTGFSPTSGPVGTTVTINGSDFGGATGGQLQRHGSRLHRRFLHPDHRDGAGRRHRRHDQRHDPRRHRHEPRQLQRDPRTERDRLLADERAGRNVGHDQRHQPRRRDLGQFNGTSAVIGTNSPTSITTTVPAGATDGTISVTTPGGTDTSPGSFNVTIPPVVTGFSPTSGPVGTSVTINGTDLTGATSVKFNGTAATFAVDSSTQITTTVPAGATDGTISVTTPGGTDTSPGSFNVIPPPNVTGYSPTVGTTGTSVTINGTNLGSAISVTFNGTSAVIGTNTPTSITTTVPVGATTGSVSVTTPGGTDNGPSFTVDTTAPVLTLTPPGNRTVEADGPGGTRVSYTVSGSDDGIALLPGAITCSPVSASVFPLGQDDGDLLRARCGRQRRHALIRCHRCRHDGTRRSTRPTRRSLRPTRRESLARLPPSSPIWPASRPRTSSRTRR